MPILSNLKMIDYHLSQKFASIIPKESNIRTILQLFSHTGSAITWTILLVLFYPIFPNYSREILTLLFLTFFAMGIVFVIKHTIRRERPHYKDTGYGTIIFDEHSFPSGHATRSTYLMILLPLYFPNLSWLIYLWGMIMIFSRLLLGLHYISDILGGIVISLIIVMVLFYIGFLPYAPIEVL